MGGLLMWVANSEKRPSRLDCYDVTIEDEAGARLVNVAMFRPQKQTWELLIDKHNYQDCVVVAWMERPSIYRGQI